MKFENLSRLKSIAVVGATGLVGKEFLELLSEYRIGIPQVKRLSAADSLDALLEDPEDQAGVEMVTPESFAGVDAAFFAGPAAVTRKFLPHAKGAGCIVVDDSGAFQALEDVPVIVPEVNGKDLHGFSGTVIANPASSCTPLALALKPLQDRFGLRRVIVSTYQPASELGAKGYHELSHQTVQLLNGEEMTSELLAHPMAFNCVPWIGTDAQKDHSDEEERIQRELRRVLMLDELPVSVTAVRVPTFCGYGAAVNVELENGFGTIETVRELFDAFPGLKVLDNPAAGIYPTNRECIGSDTTFVGRIRPCEAFESAISFWIMTDNLRKGAALNALESMEALYRFRQSSDEHPVRH